MAYILTTPSGPTEDLEKPSLSLTPTAKKVDIFFAVLCLTAETLRVSAVLGCGLTSLAMLAQPDTLGCGLYSLAMLAQPDRRTGPSLIPRGAFLAILGAACSGRGRSVRPSGLEPAWGVAVAALIPASIGVILGRRWYDTNGHSTRQ